MIRYSSSRALIRQIRNRHRLDHNSMPFTPEQVKEALEESGSSTALIPDVLTVLQLKHLVPLGLRYLFSFFNLSYAHAHFTPLPCLQGVGAVHVPLHHSSPSAL